MFKVEVENWPSTMDYHRGIDRTWDVVLTNTGNQDVEVNLTYTLLQGGLNVPSTDWSVDANAPTTLLLELNVPTRLTFKVVNVAIQPPLTLAANLIVQLDPVDPNVRGGAEYYTELGMNRFFSQGTAVLQGHGQEEETTTIMYSHIPSGQESAVAYELELCRANRLRDFNNDPTLASKDEADYPWTFAVRIDQTDYPLNMSAFCPSTGSLGPDSRITLPTRQPWDTSNPITLVVTTLALRPSCPMTGGTSRSASITPTSTRATRCSTRTFGGTNWPCSPTRASNPKVPKTPMHFTRAKPPPIRLLFTTRQPPKPWVFRPPWTVMAMLRFSHNPRVTST